MVEMRWQWEWKGWKDGSIGGLYSILCFCFTCGSFDWIVNNDFILPLITEECAIRYKGKKLRMLLYIPHYFVFHFYNLMRVFMHARRREL